MPTVDNKIVQMTFKNEQFERGVKESLHSLEELKKALDLDKSAESLSNLEKIASSFDISGIAKGIDDIAGRFTLLGNLGQEAFRRISSFALDEVHKVTSAITSMPQAGMNKYEQKNKAIQMIQSAMPEKSIEEIEAVLAKLNEYTDLTSYDFSTMANSIGKFVSAGIDLDVAEKAMEGIANETASAGGEIAQANIAMYNFSQALATGAVKLMDWHSIENQNLATKEFKEQIIETAYELGTLGKVQDKVGVTAKGTTVTFENFAQTLQEGWFTSDVLIKVLEKYADRESDVGKKGFEAAKIAITLTQAFDAVKDAISTGWMTSFGYLFGNLEEAGDLFTRISDALIGFAEQIYNTRNELLKGWHDGGEDGISGYQKVIEGLSNVWAVFNGIVEGTKNSFKQVFGILDSSGLIEASKAFADYTGRVKEFFGVWTEEKTTTTEIKKVVSTIPAFAGELAKGMRDSKGTKAIEEMQKRLLALRDPLIQLDKYGADGIFGPETQEAIKAFQKSVGLKETGLYDQKTYEALYKKLYPSEKIVTEIHEDTEEIQHMGKGVMLLSNALKGVFSVAKAGINIIKFGLQIAGQLFEMITPVASGIFAMTSAISNVISYIVELASAAISGKDALGGFSSFLSPVSNALQRVGTFLTNVAKAISYIVDYLRSGVNLESLKRFFELGGAGNSQIAKYGLFVIDVLEKIRSLANAVKPVFESLISTISGVLSTIGTWLSGKLLEGLNVASAFLTNLFSNVNVTELLTKVLNGLGTALQVVLGIVAGAGYGLFSLAKAAVEGGTALFNFVKNSELIQNALASISRFVAPVKEFFVSVWESLSAISSRIGTFKSFKEAFQAFLTEMNNNPIGKKFIPVIQNAVHAVTNLRDRIKGFVESIKKAFSLIKEFKDPKKALGFLSMTRDQDRGAAKLLTFVSKLIDFFRNLKGSAGGAKNAIGGVFGNVISSIQGFGQKLGEMFGGFFSMDTSGIEGLPQKILARLQAFNPVIEWVKTKFNDIKEFLTDPKKLLSHVVGALKGIGEFIIGIFKNVDLGTIWDTAKAALGTYIMLSFAGSLKTLSKSVGILTGAVDKDEKDGIGGKLRSIAITIGIVTAALAALAFIPAKEALIGVGIMALALAAVGGAMVAMNKWAPKTKDIGEGILAMAKSIVAVGLSIGLIAIIVKTFGDLTKPLLLVGGIMAALGVAAWAMSKFGKKYTGATKGTAQTILAICAGIYLVVIAIGKMASIIKKNERNTGRLHSALGYVAGIMAVLGLIAVGMAKVAGNVRGEGLKGIASTIIAICTGVGSVVSAVGKMATVMKAHPDEVGWAYAMIEGILITMGGVAVLLAKFSKDMDYKVSLASAAPIVAMGFFLDKVVEVMAEGIQKISGVDPKIIEDFLIGVGGAVAAMVGTVAIFSKIGITGLLEAAGGIVLVMTAIGAGVDIVATFAADAVEKLATAMWIVGSSLGGFSDLVVNIDSTKIEQVMGTLTNTILPAIGKMVVYSGTVQAGMEVASDIRMLGVRLGLFQRAINGVTLDTGTAIKKLPEDIKATVEGINAIQGIDEAKDVLTNLGGALALYYGDLAKMNGETPTDENGNFDINKANEAFGNLAELTLDDETIKKIKSYATDGDNDLNSFAIGIENLGTALKQYGEDIGTLNSGQVGKANDVIDKVKDIDEHINPVGEVNFDVLNGKRRSITDFGDDIAALGGALASYGDSVANLNPGKIVMANIVIDAVARLADNLPTTGGLWHMLTGEQKLGEFAANMSNLGDGLAQYANKVSDANFTNVDASVGPITALANAQSIIQKNGGLASVLSGSAKLGQLGTGLVGLGDSLVQFATADKGIKTLEKADFTKISQAINQIKKLAEAQSILQNEGGWAERFTGSSNLGNLGQGLENFATHLIQFNTSIKDFDFDDAKFVSAMELLQRIVTMQQIIQNGDAEYDFANAGRNLSVLFSSVATAISSDTEIINAVDAAVQNINNIIKANSIDPAYTWGSDLVINFANGMRYNLSLVENAAIAIANVIRAYLHFSVPDKGPLADMMSWMPDFVGNIADGITGGTSKVEGAAEGLGSVIKNAVSNGLGLAGESVGSATQSIFGKIQDSLSQEFSNLFGDGTDSPVITPVLDLSNIEDGASQIGGMLSGQSVSASTDMAKNVMSGNGVTIVQGGAAEDHSPEIISAIQELGNRIVTLETQMASHMSNLKVVMNTNALVGQIAPTMDRVLGGYANRN